MKAKEWKDDWGRFALVEFGETEINLNIIATGAGVASRIINLEEAQEIHDWLYEWLKERE